MTTYTLTVTFDIDADSPQSAVFLVNKALAEKGIKQGTEVEVTPGSDGERRVESRFGYRELTVEGDNNNGL